MHALVAVLKSVAGAVRVAEFIELAVLSVFERDRSRAAGHCLTPIVHIAVVGKALPALS